MKSVLVHEKKNVNFIQETSMNIGLHVFKILHRKLSIKQNDRETCWPGHITLYSCVQNDAAKNVNDPNLI